MFGFPSQIIFIALVMTVGFVDHVVSQECECKKKIDVFILVDMSASIGSHEFERTREFVTEVTKVLCIGPSYSNVALASFSGNFKREINLSGDRSAILQGVADMVYMGTSRTDTGPALRQLRHMVIEQNRARIPAMAIVVTDGIPFAVDAMIQEATNNHLFGLRTLAVSLGLSSSVFLRFIASKPLESNSFSQEDAINTLQLATKVVKQLCKGNEPGYCIVTGDPHVELLDGWSAISTALCTYTLITTCPNTVEPSFRVDMTNEMCGRGTAAAPVTCAKEFTIYVYGITIRFLKFGKVLIDGKHVSLPQKMTFKIGEWIEIRRQRGPRPTLFTDFGLSVQFYRQNGYVQVPAGYKGKTCALCGNFNGIKEDDFILKDGTQLTVPKPHLKTSRSEKFEQLVQSWVVHQVGHEHEECAIQNLAPLNCAKLEDHEARGQCAPLMDLNGLFGECLRNLDGSIIQALFDDCVFDVCEKEDRCNEFETLVAICLNRGFQIPRELKWRKEYECPLTCGQNAVYKPFMTACPPTCAKPNAPDSCAFTYQEGCQCNSGFIWEDDECIPKDHCGCIDSDGKYHKAGESWLTVNCLYQKSCDTSGFVKQMQHMCPIGTTCIQSGNDWTCA